MINEVIIPIAKFRSVKDDNITTFWNIIIEIETYRDYRMNCQTRVRSICNQTFYGSKGVRYHTIDQAICDVQDLYKNFNDFELIDISEIRKLYKI